MTDISCAGATDVASLKYLPQGQWRITINNAPTIFTLHIEDALEKLSRFFATYDITLNFEDDILKFKNLSTSSRTVLLENISESIFKTSLDVSAFEYNPTLIVHQERDENIISLSFCLAPSGVENYTPSNTLNPSELFGTPDDSCYFPLADSVPDDAVLVTDFRGLQNVNATLLFTNKNETDIQFQILKMEGSGRFNKSGWTTETNPTLRVSPIAMSACLRGNTCVPSVPEGVIDFSSLLVLNDEVYGEIEKDTRYFDTLQLQTELKKLDYDLIELFPWEEPSDYNHVPCVEGYEETVIRQSYQFMGDDTPTALYTVIINDFVVKDIRVEALDSAVYLASEMAYEQGRNEFLNDIVTYSDSSSNLYFKNTSNSKSYSIIIQEQEVVSGMVLDFEEHYEISNRNMNPTVLVEPSSKSIYFCLTPPRPLHYIEFGGWFGEGWKNKHKYTIEVNGVKYRDPIDYTTNTFFVGSLQDVVSANSDALYMFNTYVSSDGGGAFVLTEPGRYDIRFIKEPSTFAWDESIDFWSTPYYTYGQRPEIDSDGNWSFTLEYIG